MIGKDVKNICKVDKNVNILLSGLLQVEEKLLAFNLCSHLHLCTDTENWN